MKRKSFLIWFFQQQSFVSSHQIQTEIQYRHALNEPEKNLAFSENLSETHQS